MYGATYAGKIWQNYMNTIHEGLEKEDFIKPETVKKKFVDLSGVPTDANTGKKDYFSLYAENKRSLLQQAKDEAAAEKKAEKKVSAFEKFQIEKVEDCYLVDEKYKAALQAVAAVENADIRIGFSTRIADKYSQLQKELENWKDIMAAYEIEQTRKTEEAKQKAAEEAAAAAKEQKKQLAISRFRNALKVVEETTDVVTDYTYTMLELASKYLSECAEYSEYDSLLEEYNTQKDRIAALAAQNTADEQAQEAAENAAAQARESRIQRDRERVAAEEQEKSDN